MRTVSRIIRERREALGLSLSAVAGAAGSTKSYLSMIENERVANPPSARLLGQLERVLELPAGELQRAADWQSTPAEVRAELEKLAHDALRGRSLAAWLKESTSRRQGGGKNLDKLYRSGALRKRIEGTLTDKPASLSGPVVAQSRLGPAVPLINKVAAGYPTDFTDLDYPARIADEYVACPALNDPDAFAASVVGESMMPEYREGDIVIFSPLAKVVDGCDCFVRLEPDHETTFKRVFIDEAEGTIRLQPLNPVFPPVLRRRDEVAGMYRAVWRFSRL